MVNTINPTTSLEELQKEITLLKGEINTLRQEKTMRTWKIDFLQRIQLSFRKNFLQEKYKNLLSLDSLVNKHKGQRCFIVGNGPSLKQTNMNLLKNEVTFGSNRVYLGFKEWGFPFTYWGIQDETQIHQSAQEYVDNIPDETIKFIPYHFVEFFNLSKTKNCCPINIEFHPEPYPQFSNNPHCLFTGWTITYALLQLAVIMGCNPIYLVGMDYNYNITDKEKRANGRWSDDSSKNHFHPDYCNDKQGVVWNMPRFDYTNPAFKHANLWAQNNNIQIINATPNSQLNFFPKTNFNNLLT